MPEFYDQQEAERLAEDAAAIVEEAWCEDGLVERLLLEVDLAGAAEARASLIAAVKRRKTYYLTVSALWSFLAEGARVWDMAKIRGAHVGLRPLKMKELAHDDSEPKPKRGGEMSNDYDRLIRDVLAGASEKDPAPSDDEALKQALLDQSDEKAFGQDPRTDDELWSDALGDENFRAHIRGEER